MPSARPLSMQRKLGNLPAKAPRWKPEQYKPEVEAVKDRAWVERHDVEELQEELEDEFVDDRFLEGYRRVRHLRTAAHCPRAVLRCCSVWGVGPGSARSAHAAPTCWVLVDSWRGRGPPAPRTRTPHNTHDTRIHSHVVRMCTRRQRRIRELQQASTRPRFGAVEEIRAAEFVQKVRACVCLS